MNLNKMSLNELNSFIASGGQRANERLKQLEKNPLLAEQSKSYAAALNSTFKSSNGFNQFSKRKSKTVNDARHRARLIRDFLTGDSELQPLKISFLEKSERLDLSVLNQREQQKAYTAAVARVERERKRSAYEAKRRRDSARFAERLNVDVNTLTLDELNRVNAQLARAANSRLRTLEQSNLATLGQSRAYNKVALDTYDMKESFLKFNKSGDVIFFTGKSLTVQEARAELAYLQKFLKSKTSTITGIQNAYRKGYDTYIQRHPEAQGIEFDRFAAFWNSGRVAEFKKLYGSDETLKILDKYGDSATLSQSNIDSILSAAIERKSNVDVVEKLLETSEKQAEFIDVNDPEVLVMIENLF